GQGLPSDADFVGDYATRRSLRSIENLGFFVAFCCFRMAAILQGVYRRALDGNASNPEFGLTQGAMVPIYATHGLDAFESFNVRFQV
ncbi:MAG: phosphotransferase family protein, partial [Pseudomonadota bacterium]